MARVKMTKFYISKQEDGTLMLTDNPANAHYTVRASTLTGAQKMLKMISDAEAMLNEKEEDEDV